MSDTSADAGAVEPAEPGADADEAGPVRTVVRSVTPPVVGRPNAEMDSLGWMLFVGLVVLLIPLLPFLALGWLLTKLFDFLAAQRGDAE